MFATSEGPSFPFQIFYLKAIFPLFMSLYQDVNHREGLLLKEFHRQGQGRLKSITIRL
jgi:hypothetical protein